MPLDAAAGHAAAVSRSYPQDFDGCRRYRAGILAWAGRVWDLAASESASGVGVGRRGVDIDDDDYGRKTIRPLSDAEAGAVRRGNVVAPGARLLLILPTEQQQFDQSVVLARHLGGNGNRLHGTVVFVLNGHGHGHGCVAASSSDSTAAADDDGDDAGAQVVRDSTVGNSILHLPARIERSTIQGALVGPLAHIESSRIGGDVGATASEAARLPPSERLTICVGAESNGRRELVLDGACTLIDVADQLVSNASSSKEPTAKDTPPASMVTNFVGRHCRVIGTSRASRILMYPHSELISALEVNNVTLYPHASVVNGCVVTNCLMQWHCRVADLSTVADSVLMEQAHVGPRSTVCASILGPDAHVSHGEIHCSVLGPNTNAHHQSLLISALWLGGRGNVGYGANVGSNHTGRCPDQEIAAGEGVFFGLSCVVKFPVSLAPYTLVSAGTHVAPQRMTMPFSLIANEALLPGWVLASSPYTVARAEIKVATRRKATRHDASWPILRPSIVRQCVRARESLLRAESASSHGRTYTEKEIPGVGACVVTDKARLAGIRAYTDCVQRYALRGLLDRLVEESGRDGDEPIELWVRRKLHIDLSTQVPPEAADGEDKGGVPWEVFPWNEDKAQELTYQKQLLLMEFPKERSGDPDHGDWTSRLSVMLHRLLELEARYAQQVRDCKRRDDVRGLRTIPGYAASHVPADADPVVLHVQKESERTTKRARQVLARLPATILVESKL